MTATEEEQLKEKSEEKTDSQEETKSEENVVKPKPKKVKKG